ncbi:MAG: FAD-dependent oxidoreductase, partial [Coriobacteriia bacterium]|nr:FAD-dependent oxidoreductase [Coriobacteriia bacterium]
APHLLDDSFRLRDCPMPLYFAGQVAGTEGYCEAIMAGLYVSLRVFAKLSGVSMSPMPCTTSFGSLVAYATNPSTADYQPMHVNFGVFPPLEQPIRNKGARYAAFLERQRTDLASYCEELSQNGLLLDGAENLVERWFAAVQEAGL